MVSSPIRANAKVDIDPKKKVLGKVAARKKARLAAKIKKEVALPEVLFPAVTCNFSSLYTNQALDKLKKKLNDDFCKENLDNVVLDDEINRSFPPPVLEEGEMVSIGGMKLHTKLDLLEVPKVLCCKKLRGKLVVGTEVFEGSLVEDEDHSVEEMTVNCLDCSKDL